MMINILNEAIDRKILQKLIFSGSRNADIIRITAKPITLKNELFYQFETFQHNNKVYHKNIPASECSEYAVQLARSFRHVNIITTAGTCEALVSKKGKISIVGRLGDVGETVTGTLHDKCKKHILPDGEPCVFLEKLGICDATGHVFDKKRAKYRQINRFLEIVRDLVDLLPKDIFALDLCCGKSYLSFALYWYLKFICSKNPTIVGIDLKSDIVNYCNEVAKDTGFTGLSFKCDDIINCEVKKSPDLVVSLHACDVATDIVLAKAVKSNAKLILSSPCCHHEMMHQLNITDGFTGIISDYSMLKQKFCDAATDALRSRLLEAFGYNVEVIEFIDPDETPKNLLIRGVYTGRKNDNALEEYKSACRDLGIHPTLAELLDVSI